LAKTKEQEEMAADPKASGKKIAGDGLLIPHGGAAHRFLLMSPLKLVNQALLEYTEPPLEELNGLGV